jgi:hypothetical protein
MKPDEIFEQVSLFLPKYLTPSQKQELYSEMQKFPGATQFYLHRPDLPHYQERCHPSYSQTRGLDGAEQCVVTARRSRLMSEGG